MKTLHVQQPKEWTPVNLEVPIPHLEVPTPEPRFMTPHCFHCKKQLPEHEVTCKHYEN